MRSARSVTWRQSAVVCSVQDVQKCCEGSALLRAESASLGADETPEPCETLTTQQHCLVVVTDCASCAICSARNWVKRANAQERERAALTFLSEGCDEIQNPNTLFSQFPIIKLL
ncbi:hypothetical protein J6590_057273 [Homalodisca vitripennis]|nr:hypothetical protein J6590_057273 [Homalodisca vitripennis]